MLYSQFYILTFKVIIKTQVFSQVNSKFFVNLILHSFKYSIEELIKNYLPTPKCRFFNLFSVFHNNECHFSLNSVWIWYCY